MCDGIGFVNKIDVLLNELGLTRKEFTKRLQLSPNIFATWKTRNIIPPIDTVVAIAHQLEVSVQWLITEENFVGIYDCQRTTTLRRVIRKKIYQTISKKLKIAEADNIVTHNNFFTNMPDLTYRLLYNWAEGRINLNEFVLIDIAYLLGINLDYLFSKQENNSTIAAENDKYILETAHRNLNDLFCLDNLTAQRKQTASSILNQLMELEHFKYIQSKNNSDDNSHH